MSRRLAKAFKKAGEENAVHVSNIVTCENRINPAKDLKEAIVFKSERRGTQAVWREQQASESVIMCTEPNGSG